ncbi:MAG: winged helix DNA-binding domain-containing protein [Acidimicrobiales bacterium]|nr:winged helix DNA-binding domain-containing protein [Acidimicrobiales bacterium]
MGTRRITVGERRARLARRHRLLPSTRTDDVAAIADSVVALHSSDPVSVFLSALARMRHPSIAAVEAALYDTRCVIRFHAMRRTLWVATPSAARSAHASSTTKLLGPEHRRFVKLLADNGISEHGDDWIASAKEQVLAALHRAGEASTRQLGEAVPALRQPIALSPGKRYAATQQAHVRVLLHLGFEGVVVRSRPLGSWISSQYRWAAMDDWVPGGIVGMDPTAASAELVRRWLHAFGPATTADVQWWTGWTLRDTRRALHDAGAVVVAMESAEGDVDAWLAPDDLDAVRGSSTWVALLPGLDPTTMGWKERSWYLDPGVASHVVDRNGNAGPTIWVEGRVVGSWVRREDGTIALGWLTEVSPARRAQVEATARALEDVLGDTRFTMRFPAPIQAELLSS